MTNNLIADTANFGATGLQPDPGITEGLAAINTADPLTSLETWISNIIGILTTLGSIVFIFMFFFGAFKWITSGEDSSKIQKARDQMVQAAIGLIVMVAGYAVIGLIGAMIGIKILNPAEQIRTIFGF